MNYMYIDGQIIKVWKQKYEKMKQYMNIIYINIYLSRKLGNRKLKRELFGLDYGQGLQMNV